jgi:hypothetical protein
MRNEFPQPEIISTTETPSITDAAGSTETRGSRRSTAEPTRRSLRARRTGRGRLVAGAVLAVGLVAGTGVTMQSTLAAQERVATTAAITEATGLHHDQLGVYAGIADAKTRAHAEDTLTVANDTLAKVDGKVDAGALSASVASLGEYERLPIETVAELTEQTRAETAKAMQAAEAHDLAAAERAAALARSNTPEGARATAAEMSASKYGWGADQFSCLSQLWQKESGWNYQATNASSGAYGIVQAWPAEKLATAGADWRTNAATQIAWGLEYISGAYGTPCSAWSHSQSLNWS